MELWTIKKNGKGEYKVGSVSMSKENYPDDEGLKFMAEAENYLIFYYSSSHTPNYSTGAYDHETTSELDRPRQGSLVIEKGKLVGFHIYNDKDIDAILFIDGGVEGKRSDSVAYYGSIIPSYSFNKFFLLYFYPRELGLPDMDKFNKDEPIEGLRMVTDTKREKQENKR